MTRPSFTEALATRPWLLADGATGTNYFQMGLDSGDAPEMWNFEHPERVRSLHRRFIEAGADIVLTNTFGGNRHRLKLHNAQDQVREINIAAAKNARAEADAAGRPVYVGGSVGPTGEIMEPVGAMTHDEARQRLRRAGPGPEGRRRRRDLDRDHVVGRGTQGRRRGCRQGGSADRHHHELRHQRPHHDGHHAQGLRRHHRGASPPSPSPSAPIAASAHRN